MTDRDLVEHSLADLQAQVEKHQQLIETLFEGRPPEETVCFWNECPHYRTMVDLVVETVQVLDETRKAFKSRQLEELRKRLLGMLSSEANRSSTGKVQQVKKLKVLG
jgi:hypothetical protein